MTDDAKKRRRNARKRLGLNPEGPTPEHLKLQAAEAAMESALRMAERDGQALEGFIARIKKLDEREQSS